MGQIMRNDIDKSWEKMRKEISSSYVGVCHVMHELKKGRFTLQIVYMKWFLHKYFFIIEYKVAG